MWLRLVEKILRRLVGQHFCIIPRHKEGVLRGREFADVDFRDHEVVDKKHKLIVEKGKYKFIPRPSWLQAHPPDTSTQAIVDNSMESFDHFWKTDQLVADYLVEARQDFYREVLAESGPYLHGCVVDIGCGPGFVLKALASSGTAKHLYGLDFSLSSIKRCREEIPLGRFMIGDIYHIACEDAVFDAVLCMETLEHLEQPAEALRELFRICRRGGHVIITIPNGALDEYVGHLNFWTEAEFSTLLPGKLTAFQYCQEGRTMLFVVNKSMAEDG
jgi:2-polyprenyl-3-methyl-5-hydroxy-6-metoxy-1,4-benzoquinol methylase